MRTPEAVVVGPGSTGGGTGSGGRVGLAKRRKELMLMLMLMLVMRRCRGYVAGNGGREAGGVVEPHPSVGRPARTSIADRLPHAGTDDGAVAAELGHQIIDGDLIGKVLDEDLERRTTAASADGNAHLVPSGRSRRGER